MGQFETARTLPLPCATLQCWRNRCWDDEPQHGLRLVLGMTFSDLGAVERVGGAWRLAGDRYPESVPGAFARVFRDCDRCTDLRSIEGDAL